MALESSFFRQVMGRFATGVTIVTTYSHGSLVGLTVNSFCSVSLEPPLVLVCIDLNSSALPHFRQSGSFAVNILSAQQEQLSRCFATSSKERYEHFCYASYYLTATGSPVIDGVLAFIDARIVAEYPGGDHAIFVGQVEAMGIGNQVAFRDNTDEQRSTLTDHDGRAATNDEAENLTYYRGQYRHLAPDYQKPSLANYDEQGYIIIGSY